MRHRYSSISLLYIIVTIIYLMSPTSVNSQVELDFTEDELSYLEEAPMIEAVSIEGAAPFQYYDANGEVQGISMEVLNIITQRTGLTFSVELVSTIEEAIKSDKDIFIGMPTNYAPDNMALSTPYIETFSIIYVNANVDPNDLSSKTYAAVVGKDLPENVDSGNVKYYHTRKESLVAVNNGEADYSYGNPYSVSHYILKNKLDQIVPIPEAQEERAYRIGFLKENSVLLSIIDKVIINISETEKQTMTIRAMAQVKDTLTFEKVFLTYGNYILFFFIIIILIIFYFFVQNIRSKNMLALQNQRYEVLATSSNEFLYEYVVHKDQLILADSTKTLFNNNSQIEPLLEMVRKFVDAPSKRSSVFVLPILNDQESFFRSVHTEILDKYGNVHSVIGKLIDVSQEEAERQALIALSEHDGMTGIFNSMTTRRMISQKISLADLNEKHALLLFDGDKFKQINDRYGHLIGDKVIVNIAKALKKAYKEASVIGRVGGDEFVVFIEDVSSKEFIISKNEEFKDQLAKLSPEFRIAVSIGVAWLEEDDTYETLFMRADRAMYQEK